MINFKQIKKAFTIANMHYSMFIRKFKSPIRYQITQHQILKAYTTKWKAMLKLDIKSFSNELNKYSYLSDPNNGKFDYTIQQPEAFFDKTLTSGRDCDDFCRMWCLYLANRSNVFRAYEIFVMEYDNKDNPNFHMTCVAEHFPTGKFFLLDYNYSPVLYLSIEEALTEIALKYNYKNPKNLIYSIYKVY